MAKDWTNLYRRYRGLWVALANDEETVLGFGSTAQEAITKARRKSADMPYLTRVPNTLDAYVGLL